MNSFDIREIVQNIRPEIPDHYFRDGPEYQLPSFVPAPLDMDKWSSVMAVVMEILADYQLEQEECEIPL